MSIPVVDQKAIWGGAAKRCSYRSSLSEEPCRKDLVSKSTSTDDAVILGEMAHIEGENPGAARYRETMTDEERNGYPNLILLCPDHHRLVDRQVNTYTVARLREMKKAHEEWVRRSLRPVMMNATPADSHLTESLHSSLLPIERFPSRIFAAPCSAPQEAKIKKDAGSQFLPAFILRDKRLYSFWNLRTQPDYLSQYLDLKKLTVIPVAAWENDPAKSRYLTELLERCLNKITGHRGLALDKAHHRYYFPQKSPGKSLGVSYTSVGGRRVLRSVVWNPVTKATNKPKNYWAHQAVGLRFFRVAAGQWVLNLRPEFHFTRNGHIPLESKRIGPRSTKAKSRMWNYDLLQEVQFWRDYLGESQPRIILNMDGQSLVISCVLLRATISWPGIPDDVKVFRTADIEDDLFSVADLQAVLQEEQDAGFEDFVFTEGESLGE